MHASFCHTYIDKDAAIIKWKVSSFHHAISQIKMIFICDEPLPLQNLNEKLFGKIIVVSRMC